MRFRKLRIAWSVLCGMAYLLLVALWLDSYRTPIFTPKRLGKTPEYQVRAFNGAIDVIHWRAVPVGAWTRTPSTKISIPLLPLTLVAALAVFAPWMPWSNRFSVRTLIIATTLVAVVLGLAALAAPS